ncbi:MAG: glycosyltransferase family 4 protein [Hyphomicrobiaceae bacterium]
MAKRIAYLVTEDWYFLSHRLPMARAAKAAGFDVHVLCRIAEGRAAIEAEGFTAHALGWSRGSVSPAGNARAIAEVAATLKRIAPSLVHNIALKPALLGSVAAAIGQRHTPVVSSITGVGSAFLSRSLAGRVAKGALGRTLAALMNRRLSRAVVQNPDDRVLLTGLGVRAGQIVLIPGSGVDTQLLQPVPELPAPPVRVAFVGRMLEDKGVRALVEAHRILRRDGLAIELLLAGDPDPENPTSISRPELEAWAREPGITWNGHVRDIKALWASSHIAVLPSRREGLPKSLLEAAACGRPMVATDAPGCREVAIPEVTGLLVPIDDAAALAVAVTRLATNAKLRMRMGAAARALAVDRFSADAIGQQTVTLYRDLIDGRGPA